MKITKKWGMILLCAFLILWGLTGVLSFSLPSVVLPIIAIAAGVLLLIDK